MNVGKLGVIGLIYLLVMNSNVLAQNYLFKHPRQSGFKFVHKDGVDITTFQHFSGSGIMAVGFYRLYRNMGWRQAKLKAGLTACVLGLLKEFEDGYREGWGRMDTFANQLGIMTFLIFADYTRFTFGIEQLYQGTDDYGLGIRFFRFKEISPLKTSFGFFALYNVHRQPWVGIDTHFHLLGHSEVHLGLSVVNLHRANQLNVKPNVGISFYLF